MTKSRKPPRPAVTVARAKNNEGSFGEILDMLLDLHKANGLAAFDATKAAEVAFRIIEQDMCWVARVGKTPVGTLALVEETFWYGDQTFLQDAWFWVAPEYRPAAGTLLMKAARDEAQARNRICLVSTFNPDRRPKGRGLVTVTAGFVPIGYTLLLREDAS